MKQLKQEKAVRTWSFSFYLLLSSKSDEIYIVYTIVDDIIR